MAAIKFNDKELTVRSLRSAVQPISTVSNIYSSSTVLYAQRYRTSGRDAKIITLKFPFERFSFDRNLNEIAAFFHSEKEAKLINPKDESQYFMAKLSGEIQIEYLNDSQGIVIATVTMLASDGIAHAITTDAFTAGTDSIFINNTGTYRTPINWRIKFNSDTESIGLVTEDRIMQYGHTTTEDTNENPANLVLFNDDMSSAQKAQYSQNVARIRWREDSGDNTSQIKGTWAWHADGYVYPTSYGAASKDDAFWHGPTLSRYFPETDYAEVYARVNFKPGGATKDKAKRQGLMEINMLDADNNFIAGIELKDNTDQKYQVEWKFYVGNEMIKSGFLPSKVLTYNGGFFGAVKIKKIGNLFDFYLCRLNDTSKGFTEYWRTTHQWTNEAVAMLKPSRVDVNMLNWRDKLPMSQSLTHLSVTQYNVDSIKKIPLTFLKDDELFIDGDTGKVYLNGIMALDYEVIGSQTIVAETGETEVFISAETEGTAPTVEAEIRRAYL